RCSLRRDGCHFAPAALRSAPLARRVARQRPAQVTRAYHRSVGIEQTEVRGAGRHHGIPAEELIEDFRLACISRALDDREISLQTQSRVFFQISGAGHEALLLGLARHLRPGYDWFFPYYR